MQLIFFDCLLRDNFLQSKFSLQQLYLYFDISLVVLQEAYNQFQIWLIKDRCFDVFGLVGVNLHNVYLNFFYLCLLVPKLVQNLLLECSQIVQLAIRKMQTFLVHVSFKVYPDLSFNRGCIHNILIEKLIILEIKFLQSMHQNKINKKKCGKVVRYQMKNILVYHYSSLANIASRIQIFALSDYFLLSFLHILFLNNQIASAFALSIISSNSSSRSSNIFVSFYSTFLLLLTFAYNFSRYSGHSVQLFLGQDIFSRAVSRANMRSAICLFYCYKTEKAYFLLRSKSSRTLNEDSKTFDYLFFIRSSLILCKSQLC